MALAFEPIQSTGFDKAELFWREKEFPRRQFVVFLWRLFDMRTYQNWIGGEWVPAESGQTIQNVNPADTREVVAEYPLSGKDDAVAAIDAAKTAYSGWAALTPVARAWASSG